MEQIKIIIPNTSIIHKLEQLQYELNTYKDLIKWYTHHNLTLTDTAFLQLKQNYNNTFLQYNKLKQQFEKQYIKTQISKIKSWYLNFDTHEVIIYYDN